ncbi:hypothetical protein HTT03_09750 [Sulfitobacter sp. S0837]|uniref:hypothetical protein n=1 Tax=Sulfitobacter maritimus TaxID=2741719 RepID=UPI001581CDE1|nr:hypothetical protein [Sulfitobacter maritimus]NUH63719.1 hypothetical protein [Sulfitobacter maritimus]NUH63807.1 hypothetical protein [Sulfitobacter maritimus]NUH65566.1 hypothetical protein [Sulfitobacter maritimus]
MQAQVVHDTSAKAPPVPPKRPAVEPVSRNPAASAGSAGEPSPARILTEAFEDLRRRMATLEGRIVEGSTTGEVARIAQMLERVEDRLGAGAKGSTKLSKRAPGKLLVTLLTLCAFGIGIFAAEHMPELGDGLEQITLATSTFWQAGLERIGELNIQ